MRYGNPFHPAAANDNRAYWQRFNYELLLADIMRALGVAALLCGVALVLFNIARFAFPAEAAFHAGRWVERHGVEAGL